MDEDFFTGIGNEVIYSILAVLVILVGGFYIIFSTFRYSRVQPIRQRTYDADQRCPICLNDRHLSVETNCGHVFCGLCLRTMYYNHTYTTISCPFCRENVSIIFSYFTEIEANAGDNTIITSRDMISRFISSYNTRFFAGSRNLWQLIRHFPTLVRHTFSDLFQVGGRVRLLLYYRIVVCLMVSISYMVYPFGTLAELLFDGFTGFYDDVLVCAIVALFVYVTYSHSLVIGEMI